LWCSALTDPDLLALPPARRWTWVALCTLVKEHGTNGVLKTAPNPALAYILGVPENEIGVTIQSLPHVTLNPPISDNGIFTVTVANWYKYQVDSTSAERQQRSRSKKRREEKRREEIKTTPKAPHGGAVGKGVRKLRPLKATSNYTTGFEAFWKAYPSGIRGKVGKASAFLRWQQINPNDELQQTILRALRNQATWPRWTKENGKYIPDPSTWLNQGRWDDEPPDPTHDDSALKGSVFN